MGNVGADVVVHVAVREPTLLSLNERALYLDVFVRYLWTNAILTLNLYYNFEYFSVRLFRLFLYLKAGIVLLPIFKTALL